jgi:LPS export ABC transporter protein LptC
MNSALPGGKTLVKNFFSNKMNSNKNDENPPALPLRQTRILHQEEGTINKSHARVAWPGMKESGTHPRLRSSGQIKINFFIAAGFLLGCFFIAACGVNEEQLNTWTGKKVMVEEGKNIEGYLSQESKVKAKLTAPLMLRYEADTIYMEFPKSLHVDFYDDSTRIETWLDSKHGKYFESLKKVYLWDSVVVINVQGDTLKSADLWWDQNTELFYTEKYAEYRTKDKQIFPGKGLQATQDFKSIIFKQPIGTVQVSDKNFSK